MGPIRPVPLGPNELDTFTLLKQEPGGLREEGSYIWDRTSGAVGSVRALLGCAARAAISSGTENIDRDVLDGIKIDAHAEAERVTRARSTASAKGSATRGKKDLHEQTSTGQR